MNLLLDTCTFIWLASNPIHLSAIVADEIQNDRNALLLSLGSAWEICLKYKTGKIQLPDEPLPWISGRMNYWKIKPLEIDLQSICQTVDLPNLHKDPFDRLLIAQALTNHLTILTPDPLIQKYAAKTLW